MNIRTAMLADAATVANNKLYVHGGQWDRIFAPAFPVTHPALAVVLVIEVDYHEALVNHSLSVSLFKDGQSLGVDAGGEFQTGHAPGQAPGAPSFIPVALTFNGLLIQEPGRAEWQISVDGVPLATIPMETVYAPPGMLPQ